MFSGDWQEILVRCPATGKTLNTGQGYWLGTRFDPSERILMWECWHCGAVLHEFYVPDFFWEGKSAREGEPAVIDLAVMEPVGGVQ